MSKRKGKKESGRTPLLASFPSDESSPRSSASKRDLFEPCRPKTIDLGEKVIKAREGGQQRKSREEKGVRRDDSVDYRRLTKSVDPFTCPPLK